MKNIKWFIVVAFLFCGTSLFAQGKYFTIDTSKMFDRYYLNFKEGLPDTIVVKAYSFLMKPKEYDLYSALWVRLYGMMEEEIFEKCDTNASFRLGLYYDLEGNFYEIFLSVPFASFPCFSGSFFDSLCILLKSMTPELPVAALTDLCWSKLSPDQRKKSNGFFMVYFTVDKALLDRMYKKYGPT